MDKETNRQLIIQTLQAHSTKAFQTEELSGITQIPVDTLRGLLRHLVREGLIQKTTITREAWNKKKTERYTYPEVWYHYAG
jgi:transcription initiation factor IIE alpha subunit